MSILLLCPPPADGAPQVGEHQIESLVAATVSVLTLQGISCKQQFFSLETNDQHIDWQTLTPDAGVSLLIFVGYPRLSISDQLQNVALSLNCPLIHIKPRFPSVLIRHDIELTGCTQLGHRLTPAEITPGTPQSVLPESYHYSQFAPDTLQTDNVPGMTVQGEIKALVALKIPAADRGYNQQHDLDTLLAALQRLGKLDAVTLMLDEPQSSTATGDKTHEQILGELAESLATHLDTHVCTQSVARRASHLIPFLRSFDIGLFGGSTLYADAIELGIPVYAWRQNESTALLNDLLDVSTTGKSASALRHLKTHINELQQELINEMTARHHALTLHNHMGQFHHAIIQLLNEVLPTTYSVESNTINPAIERAPVIPPTDTIYPGSELHASRHRLQQVQRKLLKFRQSPARFIRDSNSPLARRLHTLLPQAKS